MSKIFLIPPDVLQNSSDPPPPPPTTSYLIIKVAKLVRLTIPRVDKSIAWRWYYVCPKKVAKNGQILSMFVPKKWIFSLLLEPHQGWLFKSKNWLMSKKCQPLSLVSGFIGLNWFGFLHYLIMDTEKVLNLCS